MGTVTRQANFLLPEDLLEDLRKSVSKREQSKVVTEALRKELKRMKLQKVLKTSFGAWKEKSHPELKQGTEAYIRKIRKSTAWSSPAFHIHAVLATGNGNHYPMKDIEKRSASGRVREFRMCGDFL